MNRNTIDELEKNEKLNKLADKYQTNIQGLFEQSKKQMFEHAEVIACNVCKEALDILEKQADGIYDSDEAIDMLQIIRICKELIE